MEGVPEDAETLYTAMREWRDNCIDIPFITAKLETAQSTSGMLFKEYGVNW